MAILAEVAVGALHPLLGMDVHHVDGLAGRVLACRGELWRVDLAEFFRVVVGDDLAVRVQQIALAVALEDRPEVPPVAVIIGELGVLQLGIQVKDVTQEVQISPQAARCGALGIAVEDFADLLGGRVFLALRPHERRVGLVVPHGVAEVGVHEHVRLVHVAVHALGRRDGAGEGVLDRVARLILVDRRIDGRGLAVAPVLSPGQAGVRLAVVGIDHMAGGAARLAIVARLVVGAHEPGEGVIQAGLVNVQHRDRHAQARARSPVGLAKVRSARLFQPLKRAVGIGQTDFGELGVDVAPAPLKHPEDVAGRRHLPGRQWVEGRQGTALGLFGRYRPRR